MFKDRVHAANLLADRLIRYKSGNSIVVAIPRGGAPVGYQLAKLLGLPFEIMPCKRVRHPVNNSSSIASVTLDHVVVTGHSEGIPQDYISHQVSMIRRSMQQRYRDELTKYDLEGRTLILVDDILRTGEGIQASIRSIRKRNPEKIIVAVPVANQQSVTMIRNEADEVVYLAMMEPEGHDLKDFFKEFPVVRDEEVAKLLSRSAIDRMLMRNPHFPTNMMLLEN